MPNSQFTIHNSQLTIRNPRTPPCPPCLCGSHANQTKAGRRRFLPALLLATLLAACTLFPAGHPQSENLKSQIPNLKSSAAVLPQPTNYPTHPPPHTAIGGQQTVDIRITHVRDLAEVLVRPGDRVQAGQPLARLAGYAEELAWEVRLIELELAQAQAKLAEVEAGLEAERQAAAAAHAQQVTAAADRVTSLERHVAALERRQQIAQAHLDQARATTAYRRRWLDLLEPLDQHDPWGDLPYLVGAQSGPRGLRSDLAYREALAKAGHDLRQAQLAQQIAALEAADTTAQLEQARADLEAARTALAHPPTPQSEIGNLTSEIYQSSVRINQLRLAQARAELEQAVVKALVAGQVLEVQIDRVDANAAIVTVRITTTSR